MSTARISARVLLLLFLIAVAILAANAVLPLYLTQRGTVEPDARIGFIALTLLDIALFVAVFVLALRYEAARRTAEQRLRDVDT